MGPGRLIMECGVWGIECGVLMLERGALRMESGVSGIKGVRPGCILSPCLFNLHAERIMRNAGLEKVQCRDPRKIPRPPLHLKNGPKCLCQLESHVEFTASNFDDA